MATGGKKYNWANYVADKVQQLSRPDPIPPKTNTKFNAQAKVTSSDYDYMTKRFGAMDITYSDSEKLIVVATEVFPDGTRARDSQEIRLPIGHTCRIFKKEKGTNMTGRDTFFYTANCELDGKTYEVKFKDDHIKHGAVEISLTAEGGRRRKSRKSRGKKRSTRKSR